MMRSLVGFSCIFAMLLTVAGCGGSSEPSSIVDGVDQSAVDAYDAAIAEEENMMNDEPPEDE